MADFQINILGCGAATPSTRHMPSCQVIDFRNRLFMIDCGEGAQLQMMKQHLKFSRLSHVFISHLHGDHFLGLPGLLSTLSLHNKGGVITIHCFQEGIDVLRSIMNVFCRDTSFEIQYNAISTAPQMVYEDHALTVETIPLSHRVPCVGYKFTEKPKPRHLKGDMIRFFNIPVSALEGIRLGEDFIKDDGTIIANERLTSPPTPSASYAYCSDTLFNPSIAGYINDVDLLYHEATYIDDDKHKAAQRGHSTAREAAEIARLSNARRLLLGHFSKSYGDESRFIAEAAEVFPNVTAATEGMKIDLI